MKLIVRRLLPFLTVALLVACSRGHGQPERDSGAVDDEARAILERSATAMASITTLHTSNKQTFTQNGSTQTARQEMDQEGPTRGFAQISGPGPVAFEIVIELPAVFVRLPGRDWQTPKEALGVSFEELGFDLSKTAKSEFDFTEVAERIERLPDDVIDGETLYTIRVSGSAEAFFRKFATAIGGKGPVPDLARTVKGGTIEAIYSIDSQYRLRKANVTMNYTLSGIKVSGVSEATFSAFNVPIRLPSDFPRR